MKIKIKKRKTNNFETTPLGIDLMIKYFIDKNKKNRKQKKS